METSILNYMDLVLLHIYSVITLALIGYELFWIVLNVASLLNSAWTLLFSLDY